MNRKNSIYFLIAIWTVVVAFAAEAVAGVRSGTQNPAVASSRGVSRTLLPDGSLLILGGQDETGHVQAQALLEDPDTRAVTALDVTMHHARAWHTATVLPDGRVLVLGGIGADERLVAEAELFDPHTQTFAPLSSAAPAPRAFHTATLLTDGRVLIAGGVSPDGEFLRKGELWDSEAKASAASSFVPTNTVRRNHQAALLADGRVLLWGGKGERSAELQNGEVYDPSSGIASAVDDPLALLPQHPGLTELRASSPEDGATDVPVDALISLRFSNPLMMPSINEQTVVMRGPEGVVTARIVGAEGGLLAFVRPNAVLVPGTVYSVTFSGGTDSRRSATAFSQFMFTTAGAAPSDDHWIPTSDWRTDRPPSPWQSLPPLHGSQGATSLAGQVLKLDGTPLAHVLLAVNNHTSFTDKTGRFLLTNLTAGHQVMTINGSTANSRGRAYGFYETGVDIVGGQNNVLSYTIWMTALDTAHTVTIPSPTKSETVITSPLLPGLELHLPPNTVIYGNDGRVITEINITPIPLDRTPFPLPPNVPVPIYFTIQPGGSYIKVLSTDGPQGARLFYPNMFHYRPGTAFNFWNYDARAKGWFVYGQGRVSADGSQVTPNPGVVIYEFTGAMVSNPSNAPPQGPAHGDPHGKGGDPVDLGTGLFVYSRTDLTLSDVVPVALTRTYRPNDSVSRAFGIGTSHDLDMFLVGPNNTSPGGGYLWQDLVLPDGGRIHFNRISPCTGPNGFCDFVDAVYEHTASPTGFYGATIRWNGAGWSLTTKDGSIYNFPDSDGLTISQGAAPTSMTDRYGNTVTYARDGARNLTQITTTNGRWIKFTYDTQNRVIQAQDNINRTVNYSYDVGGRLIQVTDAMGGVTNYTYDGLNEMLTIQDPRGIFYLTNQYDSAGRVVRQTQANNTTVQFTYTTDPNTGAITQTDVTDPRGNITRTTFNANGYSTSKTLALGKPEQQKITYGRDPNTNLVNRVVDPLLRETDYIYDSMGNILSVTSMANTAAASTVHFTYDPVFNRVTSVTDPLNHVTSYQIDSRGNLTSATDPLGHQTTYTYFPNGQIQFITDPLGNVVQFGYDSGDLVSITDPMLNVTTLTTDFAGRVVGRTDPLGNGTGMQYDALNRVIQVSDAKGGVVTYSYDPSGHLLMVQDQRRQGTIAQTSYAYDDMDRLASTIDPLLRQETYQYDPAGNLAAFTDRRGNTTTYGYDALNRRVFTGFGTVFGNPNSYESTQTYAYDAVSRVTQISDTIGGTTRSIVRSYNELARTISEQTSQGTVSYAFDAAGRRSNVTVAGQPAVNYAYDDADRLTQITQSASTTMISYDSADRRATLTLPNNVVVAYGYDNNSRITSLQYQAGNTNLGNITYAYDAAGRRVQMGGTFGRTGLPQPVNSAAYDAMNELNSWNGVALSSDSDGNMLTDGSNAFTWNARNQVASVNGVSLEYDGLGRRTKNLQGTSFLYSGSDAVQELSGTTVTVNRLNGGLDEFFSRTDASGTSVPIADALGSTIGLTDANGNIVTFYSYDPYGNTSVSGSTNSNNIQYTGRENEGAGLYFYRARYYSPLLGRFISQDPMGFSAGLNLYSYASDNPVNFADPSGMDKDDPTSAKHLNRCAAKLAQDLYNSYNPARGNGLADAIYSNSFSDLSNLIWGSDEGDTNNNALLADAAVHAAAMAGEHAPGAAAALNRLPFDGGATKVLSSVGVPISNEAPVFRTGITFATRNLQVGDQAIGSTIKTVGKFLGKGASFVGSILDGKLIIDAGVYLGAEAVCAFW